MKREFLHFDTCWRNYGFKEGGDSINVNYKNFKLLNMRKVKDNRNWRIPKTRRTDFTKEEMLDIIDFYLQYKPMLDEYVSNQDHYLEFDPHDFTMLLYMYKMLDVDYINIYLNQLA